MSRTRWSAIAVALAVGCGDGDGGDDVPSGTIDQSPTEPPPSSTICRSTVTLRAASPVAEAHARKSLPIAIDLGDDGGMRGARAVKVVLTKDGAAAATILDTSHDLGTIDAELDPALTKDLALGRYSLDATAGCPAGATSSTPGASQSPLFLVRLGFTSIDVGDGDGARVELMYHAVDHAYDNVYPISRAIAATLAIPDGASELDDDNGAPRAFAKPWDDLDTPPTDAMGAVVETGATLPVSLRVGTKPDLVFTVAKKGTGLDEQGLPPIRIALGDAPSTDSIAPGAKVTVRLASSPVPAIARVDHALAWRFEAKTDSGWVEIPGADASATLRFYGVLGNAQGTAAPALPWVAVVDDATRAIAGAASDAAGARAALVKHVYEDLGLSYDRVNGASHYTDFDASFGNATFVLAKFLARENGAVINCSDCASILSTYANMIGAPLSYAIIEKNFSLHPILGIGAKEFGSPFDSGRFAFSYHAVTSSDSATTIHDATLAVDGDADPSQAPYTEKLATGMPSAEYLQRLSGDPNAHFTHVDQTTKLDF